VITEVSQLIPTIMTQGLTQGHLTFGKIWGKLVAENGDIGWKQCSLTRDCHHRIPWLPAQKSWDFWDWKIDFGI